MIRSSLKLPVHMESRETDSEPPAWYSRSLERVRGILLRSRVPEDAGHAEDTLAWLRRLYPSADWTLCFAALAHDVERALPEDKRVNRRDFADDDDFRTAHAANSARLAASILHSAQASGKVIRDATRLILHHEEGEDDTRLAALRDADALSFYTHNLPYYLLREGWVETLRRSCWGVGRLSPFARRLLEEFPFADPRVRMLVREALTSGPA
jgi:hypothetical protein